MSVSRFHSFLVAEWSTGAILKSACRHFLGSPMSNVLSLGVDGTSGSEEDSCRKKTGCCLQELARMVHSVGRLLTMCEMHCWLF